MGLSVGPRGWRRILRLGAQLASTQTKIGDRTRGQQRPSPSPNNRYFFFAFLPLRRFSRFLASAFSRTGQRRQRGLDTQHFFFGLSSLEAVFDIELGQPNKQPAVEFRRRQGSSREAG